MATVETINLLTLTVQMRTVLMIVLDLQSVLMMLVRCLYVLSVNCFSNKSHAQLRQILTDVHSLTEKCSKLTEK